MIWTLISVHILFVPNMILSLAILKSCQILIFVDCFLNGKLFSTNNNFTFIASRISFQKLTIGEWFDKINKKRERKL